MYSGYKILRIKHACLQTFIRTNACMRQKADCQQKFNFLLTRKSYNVPSKYTV